MIIYDVFREGAMFQRKTDGAAGFDLCVSMPDGEKERRLWFAVPEKISLGVRVMIPEGYVGLLTLRSSASMRFRSATTPGIIDSDYRGELMIPLLSGTEQIVKNGDRIAQLVIVKACDQPSLAMEINPNGTKRGSGGFGSTG